MGDSNVASLAQLRTSRSQKRGVMTVDEVRAVMAAAARSDPAAGLAIRLAAVAGARLAELAAFRWDDVRDGVLTVDSAIEVVSRGDRQPELRDAPIKTANERKVALDIVTLDLVERVRREREPCAVPLGRTGERTAGSRAGQVPADGRCCERLRSEWVPLVRASASFERAGRWP